MALETKLTPLSYKDCAAVVQSATVHIMSPTHAAIVLSGPGNPLKAESVETPQPSSGQVLVQVISISIGNGHKAIVSGQLPFLRYYPLTPGGGCIGRVEAVGPDTTTVTPGQLVLVDPTIVARDDPEQKIVLGFIQGFNEKAGKLAREGWRDGSWAEKVIAPLENVTVLDEEHFVNKLGYSIEQLTSIERFFIPFGGYDGAKLVAGETVVVAFATGT